jgi:hypothetical protein
MKIKFLGREISGSVIDGRFLKSRPRREFWPVSTILRSGELKFSEAAKLVQAGISFLPTDLTLFEFHEIEALLKDEELSARLRELTKPH